MMGPSVPHFSDLTHVGVLEVAQVRPPYVVPRADHSLEEERQVLGIWGPRSVAISPGNLSQPIVTKDRTLGRLTDGSDPIAKLLEAPSDLLIVRHLRPSSLPPARHYSTPDTSKHRHDPAFSNLSNDHGVERQKERSLEVACSLGRSTWEVPYLPRRDRAA